MKAFDAILDKIDQHGMLMSHDAIAPSITMMVAGEPVMGSWWSHEASHEIYAILMRLADHEDVEVVKLISKKWTVLHRRLWLELLAIGLSREGWQLDGLGLQPGNLLQQVQNEGFVRMDQFSTGQRGAAKELESRLLVLSGETHSETGAHTRTLESWQRWRKRRGIRGRRPTTTRARAVFEEVVHGLDPGGKAKLRLPWR